MDGIIIVNKPKGYTSHDIVKIAKKIYNEKIGHTGTLDPNATGVLPLLIGKGTQLSKYLINHDKTYEAIIQLGEKKDTADIEGITIQKKEVLQEFLDTKKIKEVLKGFIGIQKQIPPIYSAIQVNGKKLYEYARKGENIEIKPREIEIYNIELLDLDKKSKTIKFKVDCSKGTYIRTLCENIAESLGTVGYMKELKRTRVGDFKIENSIEIQKIKNCNTINDIITIEKFFENKGSIYLDNYKLKLFLNGVQLTVNLINEIYKIYEKDKFIGIGIVKNNLLKRDIIINNNKNN